MTAVDFDKNNHKPSRGLLLSLIGRNELLIMQYEHQAHDQHISELLDHLRAETSRFRATLQAMKD